MPSPSGTPRTTRPAGDLLRTVILVVAVFATFAPALNGRFIMDDVTYLVQNATLRAPDALRRIWLTTEMPDYWPVTYTLSYVQLWLWGENPLGYHVTTLLFHCTASLLLWRVLRRLCVPWPWLAALLFALHPVNVESAAWIIQIKNTLSLTLAAAAALLYLGATERTSDGRALPNAPRYVASLGLFLLATLSKGSTLTLPAVLLLLASYRTHTFKVRQLLPLVPFFLVSFGSGVTTLWFQYYRAQAHDVLTATFTQRLATSARNYWFYLGKALLPVDLAFVYPQWSPQPNPLVNFLPLLALVALFAVLTYFSLRASAVGLRTFSLAALLSLACYALLLLPVLGFANIYYMRFSPVSDHWQYPALICVTALAAAGLHRSLTPLPRPLTTWLLVALTLTLSFLSFRESRAYADPRTLWLTTIERNPNASLAHLNLAGEYAAAGQTVLAEASFESALAAYEPYMEAHLAYGRFLLDRSEPARAVPHLQRAADLRPDLPQPLSYLALAHESLSPPDHPAAERAYRAALAMYPTSETIPPRLARVLLKQRKSSEAAAVIRSALEHHPDSRELRTLLAECEHPTTQP